MFCDLCLCFCLSFDCFVLYLSSWKQIEVCDYDIFLVVLNMAMKMDLNGPNEHVKLVVLWICTLCPTFGIFFFHM